MRADELIKQNEPLLKSESKIINKMINSIDVKRWYWYGCDFFESLGKVHRQSYKNTSEDFKDSELVLQDFIRRYTDETTALPLNSSNARIGPRNGI